jgi:His/Glu/Gln/Arg/opine family amino acid ABC transporter permease subunit
MFDVIAPYLPLILKGTWITITVSLISLAVACALGLLGAWAKLSHSKIANILAEAYTTLIRGVPDLVLMTIIFFGGQIGINAFVEWMGWDVYLEIDAFTAGVGSIGFIYGAYMTETFRGAILAVPRGQIEAAVACGMTRPTQFRRILGPQMIRYALPSFGNNWLVLLKTTALVSVLGVQELVYNAFSAGRSTRQLFTFMLVVCVIYLILTTVSTSLLRWAEHRYSVGVRRA